MGFWRMRALPTQDRRVARGLLGKKIFKYFGEIKGANHWPIQEHGARKLTIPLRALIVNGDFVPLDAFPGTAVWFRLAGLKLAS
jgi:hypothetical protein